MSRFRTAVLLTALAALASGLLVACGGGDSDADPQEVLAGATLEGIESGKFEATMRVGAKGDSSGTGTIEVSGAFQKEAGSELPLLEVEGSLKGNAEGESIEFEGGLTLLSDRAFIGLEGTEYEVDPTTFGFVRSSLEQNFNLPAEGEGEEACSGAIAEADLEPLFENAKNEGGADVAGQETTKISGELDIEALVGLIGQAGEDPACAKELESSGGLPLGELEEQTEMLTEFAKSARGDIYVGDDGIIRRVDFAVVAEAEEGETIEVDFDLTLSEVNESQEISSPGNARPLEELFQQLGVNPLDLLEGSEEGIQGLLEGLLGERLPGDLELPGGAEGGSNGGGSGGSGGGGSSEGGSDGGSGSGSGGGVDLDEQQEYLECLGEAESAADIQSCAKLAP